MNSNTASPAVSTQPLKSFDELPQIGVKTEHNAPASAAPQPQAEAPASVSPAPPQFAPAGIVSPNPFSLSTSYGLAIIAAVLLAFAGGILVNNLLAVPNPIPMNGIAVPINAPVPEKGWFGNFGWRHGEKTIVTHRSGEVFAERKSGEVLKWDGINGVWLIHTPAPKGIILARWVSPLGPLGYSVNRYLQFARGEKIYICSPIGLSKFDF